MTIEAVAGPGITDRGEIAAGVCERSWPARCPGTRHGPAADLIIIDHPHPQPFCHRPSLGDQHPRRKPDHGKPSLLRH
jgi:hypothetical protein